MSDLISRQAAIDELVKMLSDCFYADEEVLDAVETTLKELPSAQPEPCEDAVSREAVSNWLKQYGQDVFHGKYKFSLMYIWKNLMDLPSAQPQRMRGRWVEVTDNGICIFKVCDQCGKKPLWNEWRTDRCESDYCPNCGADMREGDQE